MGIHDMECVIWQRTLDFRPNLSGVDPIGIVNGVQCDNCKDAVKRAKTNMCNPFPDRGFRLMAK